MAKKEAIIMKKVLSCFFIIVILMSVVPISAFVAANSNITSNELSTTQSTPHSNAEPLKGGLHILSSDLRLTRADYNMGIAVGDVSKIGRYTEATADGKKLLYGYPEAGTAYTTIRIDGNDYYQDTTMDSYVTQMPTIVGDSIITKWTLPPNVKVSQDLTLMLNTTEYRLTVINNDHASHHVKVRYMFDTMLAYEDGAPFRVPIVGDITTEQEFENPLFKYWKATDSLANPTLTSNCTFDPYNKPYKVQFAYWWSIKSVPFNYTIIEGRDITSDTAVGMYWDLGTLAPGETKDVTVYYGTTGFTPPTISEIKIIDLFTEFDSYISGQNVVGYAYSGNFGKTPLVDGQLAVNITNPKDEVVFKNLSTITINPDQTISPSFTYNLPLGALTGIYTINATVYDMEMNLLDHKEATFRVTAIDLSIAPEIITTSIGGSAKYVISVKNPSDIAVPLNLSLSGLDDSGYSLSKESLILNAGEEKNVILNVRIPESADSVGEYRFSVFADATSASAVLNVVLEQVPSKMNVTVIRPISYSIYTAGDLLRFNATVSDVSGKPLGVSAYVLLSGPDNEFRVIPLSEENSFFVGEYNVSSGDPVGLWVANLTAYNSTNSGLCTSSIFFTDPYTIQVETNKRSYVLGDVAIFEAEAYKLGVSDRVLSDQDVCLNLTIYAEDSTLVYGPESMNYDNLSQSFFSQADTNLLGRGRFNVSIVGEDAFGCPANATTDISVVDDFEVNVGTDKSIYDRGESVNISGAAIFRDGSAVVNANVSIVINVKGFTRTFATDTNNDGEFNYTFNPFAYEAGNYTLTATVDYMGLKMAAETGFSINGLYLRPKSETLDMAEDSEYLFNLTLFNLGENTLTGVTASLVDRNPSDNVFGVLKTSTLPEILLPGENRSFALVMDASENAVGGAAFSVIVSSDQTSDEVSEVIMRIHPNKPVMDVNPRNVDAGLNLNQSSIKSFTISNTGYGTLRNVTLNQSINSWFQLVTNESLGDIPPGGNVSVYFVISSSQVDVGNYFGVINVSSANYEPVSLDVAAYVSDSSTGSLLFYVGDPLGRNVSGANISLIDELDFDTYNLTTDERGYALVENLSTGRYIYDVFSGNGTLPQMGSVDVEPMPTPKLVNVSLGLSLIDFDWDIEPTDITDIYNIILKLKFETDVPVPVLVAHPSFLGYNFEPGSIVNGRLHLINFGMVSIKDVKLQDVGLVPHAEMEFLVNDIPEIKAKGSTQVPFKIKFSEDAPRANVLRGVVNIRGSFLHSVGGTNVHAFADTNVPVIIRALDTSFDPTLDPTLDPKFCVMCGGIYISPGIAHQNLTLDKYAIAVLTVLNHDLDLSEATNKYYITATNSNNMEGSDISFTPAIGLLLKLGLLELLPDEILGVVHFIRERYSDRQLHIITQNLEYYERITHHSYSKLSLFFRIPLGGIKNLEKLSVSLPRLQHVDSVLLGTFNPTRISPGESSILTLNRVALGAGLELPQLIGGAAFFLFGPPGNPNCLAILPIGGVEVNVGVDIPHLPSITWYWPTPVPPDWPHLGDGEYHWRGDFWWPQRIHIPSDGPSDSSRDGLDSDYQSKPTVLARTIHEVVKLSISQNATMERDAFWAGLGIYNRMSDKSIDNLKVDIIVRDSEGLADDKFFIRSPYLTGIGDIRGGSNLPQLSVAKAQWLIIPKPGAGGTSSEGKVYNISAKIRYSVDGVNYDLSTLDVPILVKPQPQIVLDYYMPSDVIANSPFKLAVKASNVGYGTARDFSIQSAQPVIYDNAAGLMIDFKILGGSESSLVCVDFGSIEPGESRFAWWELVTTLDGKFTEFTGTYTHSSELGGLDTSIIKELNTHIILREIDTGEITYDLLVDSDRNGIPDYVINSMYGTSTEVLSVDYSVTMEPTSANPTLTISTKKVEDKWICTSVDDPYENKVPIKKVERSDGEILSPQNYWMREGRILIVDDPVQEYTITYETLAPPNITNVEPGNITAICGDTIELNCLVTADIGVESVWLNYTTNNWTSYNIKIMDNPYNDSYATNLTLPGFDAIEYKVEARDKVRNIGKSSIYTVTIIGGIVLFDKSHDEIFSIDPTTKYSYSMFASILEEKGYEVKTLNSSPITTEKLDNCHILVIPAPTKPFDTNEIKAIREFVSNGGSLLLINEWGGDFRQGSNLNDISKDLGIVFNNDTVNDPTNNFHNTLSYALIHEFRGHYITKDINEFLYPAGCSLVTNNSIAWADDDSYTTLPKITLLSKAEVELGNIIVLAATNFERGRVVCIGDGDFCGDLDIDGDGRVNIDEYDNKKLILNIVEWLSGGAINEPPVASFVYSPENPVVDQTGTLGASFSHDPDGNLKSYNWTYGDGENGGTHNVTLTVTDDDGAINFTKVPLKSRMWENLKSASVKGLIIAPTQNNLKRWWL